jgi:hypothetical protein
MGDSALQMMNSVNNYKNPQFDNSADVNPNYQKPYQTAQFS